MARPKKVKEPTIEHVDIRDITTQDLETEPLIQHTELEDIPEPITCVGMFKNGNSYQVIKVIINKGKIVDFELFEENPRAISLETLKIQVAKKWMNG